MIYRIFVNNKIVSTQYTLSSVSKYLKLNHPNIKGTGLKAIRRNKVDGIFTKGILRVEEVEDTKNIKKRIIPKRIINTIFYENDDKTLLAYGKSIYLSQNNYNDFIKMITERIKERGEDFLLNHKIRVAFTSKILDGGRFTFGTKFLDFNSLYEKIIKIFESYLQQYEVDDINIIKISIGYIEVPPLQDVYIYRGNQELEKECMDDLLYRMKINNKNKILSILNKFHIWSPSTYQNCFIKSCIMAKHKLRDVEDMTKIFTKKYRNLTYNVSCLAPLLCKHLRVNIKIYFIDSEVKEFYYEYGEKVERINILVKGGHSYSLIPKEILVKYESEYDEQNKIEIPDYKDSLNDYKIAVYDLETCNMENERADKNNTETYALGYYNGKKYIEFYKNGDKDKNILLEFVKYLYNYESGNTIIYAHNGGKFDTYLLIKELLKSNLFVITSFLESNGRILNMTIRQNKEKGKEFIFRDSINLIACSLDKACKDFKPKTKKLTGDVNHNKININNCHTEEIYEYTRHYLKNDCLSLHEILEIFDNTIKNSYDFGIREVMTNASIARRVFLSKYYDFDNKTLYTLDRETDQELRKYYFGGRNECMTKLGYNKGKFYYVDFTSLYPYVMMKNKYFYGKMTKIKLDGNKKFNKKWFGFVKVLFRHKNKKNIPFHPVINNNKLVFPYLDNWTESIISTEDIKYSLKEKLGYEYKYLEVFHWENQDNYFKDIVDELYKMKLQAQKEGNKALRSIAKIIINSLYGFFGINYLERNQTEIIKERVTNKNLTYEQRQEKLDEKRKSRFYSYLLDQKLKDYQPYGKYDVYQLEDKIKAKCANVGIASMVTSYARLELYKLLKAIKDEGGNIYYMDTDSVITDLNIYENDKFKSFIGEGGENLGELTNETEQEGGYYKELITLGNKMYALKNNELKENNIIIKMKGINSKQKYDIKEIDKKNKIVHYKSINKLDGKNKIEFNDYKLLANGYNLICDNMNFISGVKEMIIKDNGLIKLSNTKNIKSFYDKANVDDNNIITPLIL